MNKILIIFLVLSSFSTQLWAACNFCPLSAPVSFSSPCTTLPCQCGPTGCFVNSYGRDCTTTGFLSGCNGGVCQYSLPSGATSISGACGPCLVVNSSGCSAEQQPGSCGDGICDGSIEDCSSCPTDCGACSGPSSPVCGDHVCNGLENCTTCPGDCGACPCAPFPDCHGNNVVTGTVCSSNCQTYICQSDNGGTYWHYQPGSTCTCGAGSLCPSCPSGQTNPHTICSGASCSSIASCGVSTCSTNLDCGACPVGQTNPHSVCSGTSCTSVATCGVSSCTSDLDCGACPAGQGKPHMACSGNSCTSVATCGANSCTSNADCGGCAVGQTQPHTICSGLSCTTSNTCGVSSCSTDSDCGGCGISGQTNPHMSCNGSLCASTPGCGNSNCNTNADCGGCPSGQSDPHMSCSGTSCLSVPGCGPSVCSTNANCGGCACTTPPSSVCSGTVYNDSCNNPTCVGTMIPTCDPTQVANTCVGSFVPMSCGAGTCAGTKMGCCVCGNSNAVCSGVSYNDSCGQPVCTGTSNTGACAPVSCGDGSCNGAETCSTCPGDCGACAAVCGDGLCSGGSENCTSCPADCGVCPAVCGDGTCNGGETCVSCAADCGACLVPCSGGPNAICGKVTDGTTGLKGIPVELRNAKTGKLLQTVTTSGTGTVGSFSFNNPPGAVGDTYYVVPIVGRLQSVNKSAAIPAGTPLADFTLSGVPAIITVKGDPSTFVLISPAQVTTSAPPSTLASGNYSATIGKSEQVKIKVAPTTQSYWYTCWSLSSKHSAGTNEQHASTQINGGQPVASNASLTVSCP